MNKTLFLLLLAATGLASLPLSAVSTVKNAPAAKAAAADCPAFITHAGMEMMKEVEAYIKAEGDLSDEDKSLLRDSIKKATNAAETYYREQEKLGTLLTAAADKEAMVRFREEIQRLMERDLQHIRSTAIWSGCATELPNNEYDKPALMSAIPVLAGGRCGSTVDINYQADMVCHMWHRYIQAGYETILDMLDGEDSYYPVNFHTGFLWEDKQERLAVAAQFKKTYDAWWQYRAVLRETAVPGMRSPRFGGTGTPGYAAGMDAALYRTMEAFMVLLLNPAYEETEGDTEVGAPVSDADVMTAPSNLKGKTVELDYTQAEFRSCNSDWLAFRKVPKGKNARENTPALYCFTESYGMAPKATRNLTPIQENGEGGIYTYKAVGPDTGLIIVDMNKKLNDDMDRSRIYTIHFTSPTEGEATEEIIMGDSDGAVRNIKVHIK